MITRWWCELQVFIFARVRIFRYWRAMTAFTILLGGDLRPTPRVERMVAGSRVIAADGGMRHAEGLGVVPELWVGDFDSSVRELIDRYPTTPRQAYEAQKASTDGEIAVEAALARGATSLVLAGAIGGERTDHAMAHMLLALSLAARRFPTVLTSGDEEAYVLPLGEMMLDLPPESMFSVIGFSALDGLRVENARYPLEDFHLEFGSTRTISNVALGPVTFTLRAGQAIVLARPYDNSGV